MRRHETQTPSNTMDVSCFLANGGLTVLEYPRFAAVWIGPKFTEQDTADIAAAIKKVYPAIVNS